MPRNVAPDISGPFTLGTVQLGTVYGLGAVQPSTIEGGVQAILDAAAKAGIEWLDTARAYGRSEMQIGRWLGEHRPAFRLVTKIRSLSTVAETEVAEATQLSLAESLSCLGLRSVDICLTHRPDDLMRPSVAQVLRQAVSTGAIKYFGGSAYSVEEARALLQVEGIGALQVPMSVANASFRDSGLLMQARDRGVAIFVRSAFLQGALLMEQAQLPVHLAALRPVVARLRTLAEEAKVTLAALLMGAVGGVPGVSSLVLGVDTVEQLHGLLEAAKAPPLARPVIEAAFEAGRGLPEAITDPRHWPPRRER